MTAAVSLFPHPAERIGVREMATRWRVSRRQARRRMLAIESEHPGTVTRDGRGVLWSTPAAIAPYVADPPDPPIVREVHMLRERVKELEQRFDAKANESSEFQRSSNAWFRRIEALERRVRR